MSIVYSGLSPVYLTVTMCFSHDGDQLSQNTSLVNVLGLAKMDMFIYIN